MTNKMIKFNLFCFTILSMVIAGCSTNSNQKNHYLLEAKRTASDIDNNYQNIIEIRPFSIDSAFSNKNLIYRISEYKYESDYYNQFLISPASMITEKTRNWLLESGLYRKVQEPGSYNEPTYILEANIISLFGDYRDKSSPQAAMAIRFFLLKTKSHGEPDIVFGKLYQSRNAIESNDSIGMINALDKCLIDILNDLEKDIIEQSK